MKQPKEPPIRMDREKLQKGQILVVRTPPFFDKEYLYEIASAGDKLIRVNLLHSPTVKKQWTLNELDLLYKNKMVRFADESDQEKLTPPSKSPEQAD